MVNSVINRRLQRAHAVLHLDLGVVEHHGSLRQQRHCEVIVYITWCVAPLPERRNSHRCPQRSASVGLAHSTSSSLDLWDIFTPVCLHHRFLELAPRHRSHLSIMVFCPIITTPPPPGSTMNGIVNRTGPHMVLIVRWSRHDFLTMSHLSLIHISEPTRPY